MARARSTALRPATPTRRKIASSSASVRVPAPCVSNFSRGRFSAGQSVIAMLMSPRPWLFANKPAAIRRWPQVHCTMARMNNLADKQIVLGITGSIAAYKAAALTRLLVTAGADVQVVMTEAATRFITPMSLQALSGHAARISLWDEAAELGMGHIELARWADCVVVAPASADTLAR